MDWSDPRIWAGVVIVAQFFFWLLGQIYRPRFATVVQLEYEASQRIAIGHEVALLKQRVDGLPTHDTISEMREDIGELKTGQAESKTQLRGVDDKLDLLRDSVNRMDDFLRAAK